jgi:circadian clock protein KaiB
MSQPYSQIEAWAPKKTEYSFQLYVAGDAQNSALAVANLRALCLKYLAEPYEIEVVDVFRHPERAMAEKIFLTPTLIRCTPLPVRRVIGTLSQAQPILEAMGLESPAP